MEYIILRLKFEKLRADQCKCSTACLLKLKNLAIDPGNMNTKIGGLGLMKKGEGYKQKCVEIATWKGTQWVTKNGNSK